MFKLNIPVLCMVTVTLLVKNIEAKFFKANLLSEKKSKNWLRFYSGSFLRRQLMIAN